jgi:hypothetical protein
MNTTVEQYMIQCANDKSDCHHTKCTSVSEGVESGKTEGTQSDGSLEKVQ